MSRDPDLGEIAVLVTICLIIYGWISFQSFIDSLGITLDQAVELIRVGSVTSVVVASIIVAECYKLGIIEKWKSRLAGGIGIGIVSAFAGSYIWLNFDATMELAAVLGAVATIVTVHVGLVAILLLIDWLIDRKDNQSQNQPPSSYHRRERENEPSSEADRMRTRTRPRTKTEYRDRARKDDSRYRDRTTESDSRYQ